MLKINLNEDFNEEEFDDELDAFSFEDDEDVAEYIRAYNEETGYSDEVAKEFAKEFTDFLNDINKLSTEKYGWNVGGYEFETDEMLEIVFIPASGADADNKKF